MQQMVTGKVGMKNKTSALSISNGTGRQGRRKIFANGILKYSDNWWNVEKTANSSTLRYALEPTTKKKGLNRKESWPEVKSSWEKTKDKKADCWKSRPGYGEASHSSKSPNYPGEWAYLFSGSGIFPGLNFIQNKGFKNIYSHTPFPYLIKKKKEKKISKSLWSTGWF